jgi:hypothetical protein
MGQPIYRGTLCRAYATFTNPRSVAAPVDVLDPLWPGSGSGNTLVDPTAATAQVMRADGSLFNPTPVPASRDSTGRWYYDFVVDQEPGGSIYEQLWTVKFVGTGANAQVREFQFAVQPSKF